MAFLSGQTAYASNTVDRSIADTVLNTPIECTNERANVALILRVADDNAIFDCAVDNEDVVDSRGCSAVDKAAALSLAAGKKGNVFHGDDIWIRHLIHTVVAVINAGLIQQPRAVDLFAENVEVIDVGISAAVKQRPCAFFVDKRFAVAVNDAAERRIGLADFSYGFIICGNCDVVCEAEHRSGEHISAHDVFIDHPEFINGFDQIGIGIRPAAFKAIQFSPLCDGDLQDVTHRAGGILRIVFCGGCDDAEEEMVAGFQVVRNGIGEDICVNAF